MSAVLGNFLGLYIDSQRVALATSNDFASKMAMIDITEKESAGFKEVMPGLDEATATLEAMATSALTNFLQWPENFANAIWVKGGTGSVRGTRVVNNNDQLLAQVYTFGTGTVVSQLLAPGTGLLPTQYITFSIQVKGSGTVTIEVGDDSGSTVSSTITLTSTLTTYSVTYLLDTAVDIFCAINKVSATAVTLYAPQIERGQTATLYKGSKTTLLDIANAIKNRTQVSILHSTYITGDQTFQYNGFLTDLQIKSAANEAVTFSVNFTGTGVQTITTLP